MQEWATSFYNSAKWQKVRSIVKARAFGLCEICGKPGLIAHHKVVLTPDNIMDPAISLNIDLLIFLCLDCHNKVHGDKATEREPVFDSDGNLVDIQAYDYSKYIIDPPGKS